jgi:cation:H+ antiporter
LDGKLSFLDGGSLFALLVAYTVFLVVQSRRETQAAKDEFAERSKPAAGRRLGQSLGGTGRSDRRRPGSAGVRLGLPGAGLGQFRQGMGVSDLVIGLTIVAAGTSMPEVATSITAAIKGERDIAVGNVVGSNTFNILGCLGLSGWCRATWAWPWRRRCWPSISGSCWRWRWPACRFS